MKNTNFGKIILDVLDTFLHRSGMSPSRLGVLALNDPTFVTEFRAGKRDPRLSTVARLLAFIKKQNGVRRGRKSRAKCARYKGRK